MRCPKCHYISFDSTDRCRNCGYEFSLSADLPESDLQIQTGEEPLGPLRDLPIAAGPESPGQPASSTAPSPLHGRPITSALDLPLFNDRSPDDDRPLVTPPAVPRQPLAVRRSSPVITRGAPADVEPVFDLDPVETDDAARRERVRPRAKREALQQAAAPAAAPVAGMAPRLCAALIDAAIVGGIAAIVLYITLEVCGMQFRELRMLPLPPLAGFLLLVAGSYFVLLTAAGGQTIGKMAAGIRVVPMQHPGAPPSDRVPLGHSIARAAGYAVSLLCAGLGLLPALVSEDRRTLHDRLADTRVVKA